RDADRVIRAGESTNRSGGSSRCRTHQKVSSIHIPLLQAKRILAAAVHYTAWRPARRHSAASPETRMVQTVVFWVSARGMAGSKNQGKPLKIRGSPKRTKASAAGALPLQFFMKFRGPPALNNRRRKTIVCPTLAHNHRGA